MTSYHALNTSAHVVCRVAALAAAGLPLLSRKGGRLHRVGGWAFVAPGAPVVLCAAIAVIFFPQPGPLVAATLAATYQYISGLRSLARFRPGPGWLDAFLSTAGLACAGSVAVLMGTGRGSWSPQVGYPILGVTALIAVYDQSRHFWAATWRRHARPIDHGLKMTGVFFAMLGAALGSFFPNLKPWSTLGPAALSLPVMLALAGFYVRARRRKRRPEPGAAADVVLAPAAA
jgi:hypothetical protein